MAYHMGMKSAASKTEAMVNVVTFRKGRAQRRLVVTFGSDVVEFFNGITRREITMHKARNLQNKMLDAKSGWSLVAAA